MQIMKTSHYLKKAGAVCMAAAMMTGCASGSSGTNGKTLTVGLNTGFNGIFSPLYYQTVYDDYVIEMVYSRNTKKVIQRCLKTRLVNQLVLDHMY